MKTKRDIIHWRIGLAAEKAGHGNPLLRLINCRNLAEVCMVTQEYLKEILNYNQLTGEFTWRKRAPRNPNHSGSIEFWNKRFEGKIAGREYNTRTRGRKYRTITINGKPNSAHRLAWIYVTGVKPIQIDHIDGDGVNNIFSNLRSVTNLENSKNHRQRKDNSSGQVGVGICSTTGKFRARIYDNGKEVSLGRFDCFDDAVLARKNAELKYGYHENHGNSVRGNG